MYECVQILKLIPVSILTSIVHFKWYINCEVDRLIAKMKVLKTYRITSSNRDWFPILEQSQKTMEMGHMFEKNRDYILTRKNLQPYFGKAALQTKC